MIKLKGAKLSDRKILKRMESALLNFEQEGCTFWACKGPSYPRDMVTCSHCYAVRDLSVAIAALRRRVNA